MKSVNKNKNDELCYESRKVDQLMERLAAVQPAVCTLLRTVT